MIIKSIIFFMVIFSVIGVNIYLSCNWVGINIYTLNQKKLPDEFKGFTIIQLTDNHINSIADIEKNKRFMKIAEEKLASMGKRPDCIFITGDLIDEGDKFLTEASSFVFQLIKKYPVYLVSGNHDNNWVFLNQLSKSGAKVLDNSSVEIIRGESKLSIVGVSDSVAKLDDADKAFNGVPLDNYNITLTHSPNIFKKLVDYGADLILCGHTHGGQIKLPFLPALYVTGQGFFPHYTYGFYDDKKSDGDKAMMYVSKGIGYSGDIRFRFFNRPEIAIFILN